MRVVKPATPLPHGTVTNRVTCPRCAGVFDVEFGETGPDNDRTLEHGQFWCPTRGCNSLLQWANGEAVIDPTAHSS
jgi:hypothetical protein